MAKKVGEKIKEGVSVEELEKLARKYTTEVFLILSIIIAAISSAFGFFTGPSWSLFFAGIGAIVSIAIPEKTEGALRKLIMIAFKKDKSTEIVVGIVRIVIAIFVPFITFAEIGLLAGQAFHLLSKKDVKKEEEEHHLPNEEEHHTIE
ncbi:MAG: hypothetical protein JXA94_06650 [Parachlamydiales bacterium]|nr:hypothetical protein [Parachlamydiales bacterium]